MQPEERIIVALDVPSAQQARQIVDDIGEAGRFYKIGYQLMPIGGLELAKELTDAGKKVFLDFKFHDIGNTVEQGVRSIAQFGADYLTVHAEPDVLRGAVAGRAEDPRLKVLAVTVLTSLDQASLTRMGISTPLGDLVLERAKMAIDSGADGIVASAMEAARLRDALGDDFDIITPGIRPAGAARNDQQRIVTPRDAINNGATRLVIGRPIVASDNPAKAHGAIVEELRQI